VTGYARNGMGPGTRAIARRSQMGTDVELLDYARETPPPNQSPNLWALVRNGIGEKSKPSALFIFTHEEGLFICARISSGRLGNLSKCSDEDRPPKRRKRELLNPTRPADLGHAANCDPTRDDQMPAWFSSAASS
jgi:hypothetical protein